MSKESYIKTSDGKRYDWNPGFRKGQILKTLKGSELALLRIETNPADPEYVDKVVFKIKRIHPKDLEPIGRHPGLMAQPYWSYPEPKVGDKFELINSDLNLVKWPRVSYKPTYHAADLNMRASTGDYVLGWKGRSNEFYLVHAEETGRDYDRLHGVYGPFPSKKSMESSPLSICSPLSLIHHEYIEKPPSRQGWPLP